MSCQTPIKELQNDLGIFAAETVSVGDLFVGTIVPGLVNLSIFLIYSIYFNRNLPANSDIDTNLTLRPFYDHWYPQCY